MYMAQLADSPDATESSCDDRVLDSEWQYSSQRLMDGFHIDWEGDAIATLFGIRRSRRIDRVSGWSFSLITESSRWPPSSASGPPTGFELVFFRDRMLAKLDWCRWIGIRLTHSSHIFRPCPSTASSWAYPSDSTYLYVRASRCSPLNLVNTRASHLFPDTVYKYHLWQWYHKLKAFKV